MLEDEIKERFREFGVACFTPIWNNGLMWSHYADSHAGYCVEYCVRGMTLALHLGFVFGFFLTMPYGKFVHGVYRGLALVRYAAERRRFGA